MQLAFLCMLIFVLESDYNILSKDDTQQNKKINSKVLQTLTKTGVCACKIVCVCMLIQLKRSPTVGRGARDVAEPIGSLEKSGKLARWDFNSSLTTVTRSSLPWYS